MWAQFKIMTGAEIQDQGRTLCRSSMTNLPLGFRSAIKGTRSLTACAEEAFKLGLRKG